MKAHALRATVAFTAAILCAAPACAADWLLVQEGNGRDEYVDASSFVRSGSNVKLWTRSIFARPRHSATNGRTYVVQLMHTVYACDRRVSTPLGYRLFSALDQGVPVEEADFGDASPGWDDVLPGTVHDKIRNLACKSPPPQSDSP